jgi:hypothetical protein
MQKPSNKSDDVAGPVSITRPWYVENFAWFGIALSFNPLTPHYLQRRREVSPLKIETPSKNMREKSTNTPIILSVYELYMVAPTCFGITLPSSGSVPSAV